MSASWRIPMPNSSLYSSSGSVNVRLSSFAVLRKMSVILILGSSVGDAGKRSYSQ